MNTVVVSDQNAGTITIRLLRDRIKLRGVPPQGADFFTAYFAFFRGYGVILTSTDTTDYGLFSSINTFFGAVSPLYLGCESGDSSGSHIEAGVLSPSVMSLEATCSDPERRSLKAWGSTLTRSLSRLPANSKDISKFRIELPNDVILPRDRDLIVHHLDDLFPPAPTAESVASIKRFLSDVHSACSRLQMGGFYVLAAPVTYNGIDLLLSGIGATITQDRPLKYTGMLLYGSELPLWVFRCEPMGSATLESQKTMALARLLRYPPVLQNAIRDTMPDETQISSGVSASFEEVLTSRVTPTDTLNSLFRLSTGFYYREVLNRLGSFQPNYSGVMDKIRGITNLKIQLRSIMDLLYDLALASQRRCLRIKSVGLSVVA